MASRRADGAQPNDPHAAVEVEREHAADEVDLELHPGFEREQLGLPEGVEQDPTLEVDEERLGLGDHRELLRGGDAGVAVGVEPGALGEVHRHHAGVELIGVAVPEAQLGVLAGGVERGQDAGGEGSVGLAGGASDDHHGARLRDDHGRRRPGEAGVLGVGAGDRELRRGVDDRQDRGDPEIDLLVARLG